jgi:hypothetical protein
MCHSGGESHRLVVDAGRATVGEGRGICGGGGVRLYWVDADGIALNWENPNCGPANIIALFCSSCWCCAVGAKRPYCGKGIAGFGKGTLVGQTSSLPSSPCCTGGGGASSNAEFLHDKSLRVPAHLLPPFSAAFSSLMSCASLLSMAIRAFFSTLSATFYSFSKVLCSLSMAFCSLSKVYIYFNFSFSIGFLSFSLAVPSLCSCKCNCGQVTIFCEHY